MMGTTNVMDRRAAGRRPLSWILLAGLSIAASTDAFAQNGGSQIPPEFRGRESMIARGVLDGNLIETNFRNHGELARWNDTPWGVWPRGIGGRHIDGIGVVVAGRVHGERQKWPFYGGRPDTMLNPVVLTYRDFGKRTGPNGELWGWLPLDGFHNTRRLNPVTGDLEPTPALSDDIASWPEFWPDRLGNPDDPGWAGQWNGFFGRGVFNADLESYYVMDDFSDKEYQLDPVSKQPLSQYGVYYASPSDSTIGGFGLQTAVRIFQWANVLAEDVMFLLYRITNVSETDYLANPPIENEGLWFNQVMDYGLGNEEGDENAAFDPRIDVVFGFDQDGIGQRPDGTQYSLGYTGFAFLESPSRDDDGTDNDQDGIVDELRFGGAGMLIEGQDAIRSFVEANYNLADFEQFNGPLEERPAFEAGRWWTGDENLDWVAFEDLNENGLLDPGEKPNSDVGLDGKGPFDLNYPGPDTGEGDGVPQNGEPNFDELDVDESDQIGLTGYDLDTRPFYESGDNLRDDTWLWDRIFNVAEPNIIIGQTGATEQVADVEPFIIFTSGPVSLRRQTTSFFSTAWIFGAGPDDRDFFRNRRTVQNIYNADYQFAQPPFTPTLTAVPGDKRVTLSWDTVAVASFDRFSQQFDFEGFKLYKGSDPLLSDARTITNIDGTPTFFKPIAQWDVVNGLRGPTAVFEGEAVYNLGEDTGLSFFYVDDNVRNGITYYYALVAYDHGLINDAGEIELDPQENVFNVSVDQLGKVVGLSQNAAVVIPRPTPAGYESGQAKEDLSRVTQGIGSGSISVRVVSDDLLDLNGVYQVRFYSEPVPPTDLFDTVDYDLFKVSENKVVIGRTPVVDVSPLVEGFVVEINNREFENFSIEYNADRTGYVANEGTANELHNVDPRQLDGLQTNWIANVDFENLPSFGASPYDFEIRWVDPADSLYTPPRIPQPRFLRTPVPIFAVNKTLGTRADLIIEDLNGTRVFDPGDALIINERIGTARKFRHRVSLTVPEGQESVPPSAGDVLRVSVYREFATGDLFQFTLRPSSINQEDARDQLKDIAVVPNPYVGASQFETRTQVSGRGERRIQFINLPQECTITIFTLRGEVVNTLRHEGVGSDGALFWNMQTVDSQDLAYGVYVYHVNAPGIGEHVGKFAVVK